MCLGPEILVMGLTTISEKNFQPSLKAEGKDQSWSISHNVILNVNVKKILLWVTFEITCLVWNKSQGFWLDPHRMISFNTVNKNYGKHLFRKNKKKICFGNKGHIHQVHNLWTVRAFMKIRVALLCTGNIGRSFPIGFKGMTLSLSL